MDDALDQQTNLDPLDQERWYVVHTKLHRETLAERQLTNQGYRAFLPRLLKSRRHARKFQTVLAPLFPQYLFVAVNLDRDRWQSINGTLGVDRLLMRGNEPEPVPRGLVEQLCLAATGDGVVACAKKLRVGQSIRVTAGPFGDLVGKLESLDDVGRVRVLLDIMGGKIPVLLPETLVVPSK
jgi:transcription elongation factor/antiterminator RfaH